MTKKNELNDGPKSNTHPKMNIFEKTPPKNKTKVKMQLDNKIIVSKTIIPEEMIREFNRILNKPKD